MLPYINDAERYSKMHYHGCTQHAYIFKHSLAPFPAVVSDNIIKIIKLRFQRIALIAATISTKTLFTRYGGDGTCFFVSTGKGIMTLSSSSSYTEHHTCTTVLTA